MYSEISPEEVSRLTNGNEIENVHGRSFPRKKRSRRLHSVKGKRWISQPSEECEGSNPTEGHPSSLTDPNILMITMGDELVDVGEEDAIDINKASKLRPRRRCNESHGEALETESTVVRDANLLKTKKITNYKNKGTDAANGDVSKKRSKHFRSNFGTKVSGDDKDLLVSSGRDNELQCVENSEMQSEECLVQGKCPTPVIMESGSYETTLASIPAQSDSEEKHSSSTRMDESSRKEDQIFEIQNSSNGPGLLYTYQRKRRRARDETCSHQMLEVERGDESRQTVELEAEDDMLLAVFYNERRKMRRVAATKKLQQY